jgi:serine/threonine protein kinase
VAPLHHRQVQGPRTPRRRRHGDHPNIVRAYDIDQDDKLHFLVMEYVDGSSLQDIIKKVGPMSVTRAAHYMRQSAMGLQHAHESAGLVHRDIKPGNILVDRGGVVKILDMGLARFFHDEEDILTKKYDENVLGTADYLAPEQALDSHGVDIRADIYSLGATFYFCLTGRTPFTEGTVAQKLIWHQTRQPKPIKQTRPEVPDGLAALIERMMSKDPAQRPQTPQEVADALAPFTQEAIGPPPEEEMPRLSPAALGLPGGESGSSASSPSLTGGPPSSGQRKSWQVPTTPGSRPSSPSPQPRPTANPSGAAPAPPKPPRPNPPSPSARVPAPITAAPPKATGVQAQRAPAARPAPSPSEEGAPWEQLASDTEELARADTPPRRSRKSSPSSTKRLGRAGAAIYERKRVLIVVGIVAAALLVVFAVLGILAVVLRDPAPAVAPDKPAVRTLLVGKNQTYPTVLKAIQNALPGDYIVVRGADHEEELTFVGGAQNKNLTIKSEGEEGRPVVWRAPAGKQPAFLLALNGVEGLRLHGFRFDGDDRCASLIHLAGKCPGLTLEDLSLQGFTGSGLVIMNCEGESARPVTVNRVTVATAPGKTAKAALEFALTTDRKANRYLHFNELDLTKGTFDNRVKNPTEVNEGVTGLPK